MTSPFSDLVHARKSIRKYKPELPPDEWIEDMLRCAGRAPSPSNRQPVRFFRIVSADIREQLRLSMTEGRDDLLAALQEKGGSAKLRNWINTYFRFSEFMIDAPLLFAVGTLCHTESFARRLVGAGLLETDRRGDTDADISAGLALNGFILRARELGLGSCILTAPLTFIAEPEALLGMEEVCLKCFVTAGFPDETPPDIPRKPLSEIYKEI